MKKVILICGKICSGKSCYARQLGKSENAVILSMDEMTYDLIGNEQGEFYDAFLKRAKRYLGNKAVEIVNAGTDVILDWGFWTRKDRREISDFFRSNQIPYEWHYIDVSDDQWKKQIEERNAGIEDGQNGTDFYLNEGLRNKLLSLFEEPDRKDIDVWYVNDRPAASDLDE